MFALQPPNSRVAQFCRSRGFWTWWDFWKYAASVLTWAVMLLTACRDPLGKTGISIIAAIIVGSAFKEWLDYHRTSRKSAELVRSIIAAKIGVPVAALLSALLLLGDYQHQSPLAKMIDFDLPLVAAVFCAVTIPSFLMAYEKTEEKRERVLDFLFTASAFWGFGVIGGIVIQIISTESLKGHPFDGAQALTLAVWTGFASCLAALLHKYEIRPFVESVIDGTYRAVEVIKVTFTTLLAMTMIGFFPLFIASSSRKDLHVFHPVTAEDWMYAGIFYGLLALIAFGGLEWFATVSNLVKGPIQRAAPPRERSRF